MVALRSELSAPCAFLDNNMAKSFCFGMRTRQTQILSRYAVRLHMTPQLSSLHLQFPLYLETSLNSDHPITSAIPGDTLQLNPLDWSV